MAKILVTGADGFIGSHLVEELVRSGRDVRAFVLYNSFDKWGWLDTVPEDVRASLDVVMGDVRDPNGVRTAMKGCDCVLHLAALIGIPYSYHAADSYVDVNIRGTLNVVQAARELGLSKVVVTSTSEVYGTAQFVPITEEHPLVGQSPYAATKIGADQVALSFYRSFGTPVAVARPFNTYGPRQSSRAVIPTVITQLAERQQHRASSARSTRRATSISCRHGARHHRGPRQPGRDRRGHQYRQRLRDQRRRHRGADRRGHGARPSRSNARTSGCGRPRARSSGCGRTTPRRGACSAGSREFAGVDGLQARP